MRLRQSFTGVVALVDGTLVDAEPLLFLLSFLFNQPFDHLFFLKHLANTSARSNHACIRDHFELLLGRRRLQKWLEGLNLAQAERWHTIFNHMVFLPFEPVRLALVHKELLSLDQVIACSLLQYLVVLLVFLKLLLLHLLHLLLLQVHLLLRRLLLLRVAVLLLQ